MRPTLGDTSIYPSWDSLTSADNFSPTFLINVRIDQSIQYFWAINVQDRYFNPPTFLTIDPSINLLDFTFPGEDLNGKSKQGFQITVSGLNQTILEKCMNSRHDFSFPDSISDIPVGYISFWFNLPDGTQQSEGDYIAYTGLLDTTEIIYTPKGTICTLNFQSSEDWLWSRPVGGRYTDAYQKSKYPTDDGFKFIEALQNWTTHWGKPQPHKKPGKHKPPAKPPKRTQRR